MSILPNTPIAHVTKLSDAHTKGLARLGINTVYDLLYYFPVRYSDVAAVRLIDQLQQGETVTLSGTLSGLKTKKGWKSKIPMAEAVLQDVTGETIKIVWFNQAYMAKMIPQNTPVQLTGKVSMGKNGKPYLTNPEHTAIPELPIDTHDSLFGASEDQFGFPLYRETKGVTSKWIYHTLQRIFKSGVLDAIEDPIPVDILRRYHLPGLKNSLLWIHTPKKEQDAAVARKRFAFEEVFLIQLKKQQERYYFEQQFSYTIANNKQRDDAFISRFPFQPTKAQTDALSDIMRDMASGRPMSRLIEGDVGSGKTFIAAVASSAVVHTRPNDKNFGSLQVAYMAPTEILATQLYENFIQYFKHTGLQIVLLTGSGCRKFPSKVNPDGWTTISRAQALKWIKNGEVPIVIGTHTLIQKKVEFKHLGLVIIDEQHRFGTRQRMQLAKKDGHIPHYLSMTATPIPRTLALTIYGDLDLSVVDTQPPGRKPVITTIVPHDKRHESYAHIQKELDAGRQAYVICPRIDEPDPNEEVKLQVKSVTAEAERLKKEVFKHAHIGILHSKMTKQKKEDVMQQFAAHELDILVATSVVEVGINVPNATNIIIEGAERFGLSQLHQLRGRVLRSTHQAYCYLFADAKSQKTVDRLQSFIKAKNGFELAEQDLMLRGAGDLGGTKQWGLSDLAMEAIKNIKMVEAARTEAQRLVLKNPTLMQHPNLQAAVQARRGDFHEE